MFPLYHCYNRERIKEFCHCDADKFKFQKCQFYNFLEVPKNEDFTKIQQEIQKKLVTDNSNISVIVASKGHISVVNS